ncbi:MerR family transcriptional regulator [Saccharospirillum mangrovi]|uniref:helix-turn-helix domain-containing protein n=1 Tax=Saccharospirillum mangrovi TaxID=2161747 RepID=UPI000D341B46|nr:MerR family transcriptional regulator [Saccharospirillum mangrovi]
MTQSDALLPISRVAQQSQTPASTIRYYEQIGVLSGVVRTEGGNRRYNQGTVNRLQMIRALQQLGFSLKDIGLVLNKEGPKKADRDQLLGVFQQRRTEITQLIGSLQRQSDYLDSLMSSLQAQWQSGGCLGEAELEQLGADYCAFFDETD